MTDTAITIDPHPAEIHSLTGHMRFVERNGRMMLQQEWLVRRFGEHIGETYRNEWRDVPVAGETP